MLFETEVTHRMQNHLVAYVPTDVTEAVVHTGQLLRKVIVEELGYKLVGDRGIETWRSMDEPKLFLFRYALVTSVGTPVFGEFPVDTRFWETATPPAETETSDE